jgi:chromosome partitioning protein
MGGKEFGPASYLGEEGPAYGGMRVVCFANEKGGVAKTTSCVNLAASLARRGKSVLCMDMDPQANATIALGLDPDAPHRDWETYALLTDARLPLERVVLPTAIPNLDVVPSDRQLSNCEKALINEVGRETRLRSKLRDFAKSIFTKEYDVVLIDCPPSMDLITINALVASTDIIVPVQPKLYSLKGMARLAETVATLYSQLEVRIRLLGILVCLYDRSASLDGVVYDLLKDRITREYGDFVFRNVVAKSVVISEAEAEGRPVVAADPESAAALAYEAVAEEMLQRLEKAQSVYA